MQQCAVEERCSETEIMKKNSKKKKKKTINYIILGVWLKDIERVGIK